MKKIQKILIGTNNPGKYKEICDLLPEKVIKYSPKEFDIKSPEETGKNFEENSLLKATYFSKKTNLICLSDDSGLAIDLLKGFPGIYSSRWAENNNFNRAIEKVFYEMNNIKKDWKKENSAKFICCLSIYWPTGESVMSKGIVNGSISYKKRGNNGFGYDPIFIPEGHKETFGEMKNEIKMSIDHRFKAYLQLKKYFS